MGRTLRGHPLLGMVLWLAACGLSGEPSAVELLPTEPPVEPDRGFGDSLGAVDWSWGFQGDRYVHEASLARLSLPLDGGDPVIWSSDAGSVSILDLGSAGTAREVAGTIRYERDEGGESIWQARADGAEQWIWIPPTDTTEEILATRYRVTGGSVEQVDDAVIVRNGELVLKVEAPLARTASGRELAPRLSVADDVISLWIDADGEEVLVDPVWLPAGNNLHARQDFVMVKLNDGRILAVGSGTPDPNGNIAEIYDPSTKRWTEAGVSPTLGKTGMAASLMLDGRVLLVGGEISGSPMTDVAFFDPSTLTWTPGPSLPVGRSRHAAVTLDDGRVLVAGGTEPYEFGWVPTNTFTIFDPVSGLWSALAPSCVDISQQGRRLSDGRFFFGPKMACVFTPASNSWSSSVPPFSMQKDRGFIALLPSGQVLLAGGSTAWAARWDPLSGTWASAGTTSSLDGAGAALPGFGALLVGGVDAGGYSRLVERYDAQANSWTAGEPLSRSRPSPAIELVDDDTLLLCGSGYEECQLYAADQGEPCLAGADCTGGHCVDGVCCDGPCDAACESCSIAEGSTADGRCERSTEPGCMASLDLGSWRSLATPPHWADRGDLLELQDGRLISFGTGPFVDLYDPSLDAWTPAAPLTYGWASWSNALVLSDGRVLVPSIGGVSQPETYDPAADAWTETSPVATSRSGPRLLQLADGGVLMLGGATGLHDTGDASVDRFDSATGVWTPLAPMLRGVSRFAVAQLNDGRVVVTGGNQTPGGVSAETQIYDPVADQWAYGAPMPTARTLHEMWRLPDGRLMVAGGESDGRAPHTFVYDPANDSWSSGGQTNAYRDFVGLAQLSGGRTLLVGGVDTQPFEVNNPHHTSSEVWDPATGIWTLTTALSSGAGPGRAIQTSTGHIYFLAGDVFGAGPTLEELTVLGEACATSAECQPWQFCTDGVCCDSPCDGACEACSMAAGASQSGTCEPISGVACDDANLCTTADTCSEGACAGTPIECVAADECHSPGSCEPATGMCTNPAAPDGTPCRGGLCQAGVCVPDSTSTSGGGMPTGGAGGSSSSGTGGMSSGGAGGASGSGAGGMSSGGGRDPSSKGGGGADQDGGAGDDASEGGCSCVTAPAHSGVRGMFWLPLVSVALYRRRQRARSPVQRRRQP